MHESAKVFIPVVLGTPREGRRSEAAARYLVELLQSREDVATELIDVAALDLPARGPEACSPRATTSLPVPVSPDSSTVAVDARARSTSASTDSIARLRPMTPGSQ